MRCAARRWPWAGVSWWKTSRTCPVKVGDFDTDMRLICREGLTEAFLLTLREPITRGAQKKPDLIEGITLAPAVTGRVLLDAATHLTWGVASELDDMEGTSGAGGVLEQVKRWRSCCPWKGSSVAIRTPARKSSPRSSSQFSCAVPDLPGTRSNKRAVGCSSPRVRSTMPVNSRGPRRRRSWRCHTCSSTPNTCTPAKRAVFRCGLQTRLDVGPHGIPRGCQLSGQSCDGGSFEAQLSDRPADRPGAQTRPDAPGVCTPSGSAQ